MPYIIECPNCGRDGAFENGYHHYECPYCDYEWDDDEDSIKCPSCGCTDCYEQGTKWYVCPDCEYKWRR